MTEKEFKKITELLDDKITLYQAIGEPFGKDLDIAIKLSFAYEKLQQENKKLNGAIQTYDILLKSNVEENKKLKDKLSKIETLIINHNCDTGDIYYKYNSRFLKSELKQRILEILYEEGSDSNVKD